MLQAQNAQSLGLAFALIREILNSIPYLGLTHFASYYPITGRRNPNLFCKNQLVGIDLSIDDRPTWGRPDLLNQVSFRDLRHSISYRDSLDNSIELRKRVWGDTPLCPDSRLSPLFRRHFHLLIRWLNHDSVASLFLSKNNKERLICL